MAFFKRTLLRGARKTTRKGTRRSRKRQDLIDRLWAALEEFAAAFNGFVLPDGRIVIFVGARRVAKPGVLELLQAAFYKLFWKSLPGVPAENRWESFHPFVPWCICFCGLVGCLGARAFMRRFADHTVFGQEISEENLNDMEKIRVQNGKRMGMAKGKVSAEEARLGFQARGFSVVAASSEADKIVRLLLRDVG